MEVEILKLYQDLPKDVAGATKLIVEAFLSKLYPFLQQLGNYIQTSLKNDELKEYVNKIYNIFILCVSQINKCYLSMIDILKLEHQKHLLLLESRKYILERLSWCCSRLVAIYQRLQAMHKEDWNESCLDDSIFIPPIYFVNWIDQIFDILQKLTDLVSNIAHKKSDELYDLNVNMMVEYFSSLHTSIDELLLSAMTLCRYCLPADQHIIKARCQVVLRETKALLNDVIDGDIDTIFDDTIIPLKLPIKPSNVNVLIDVLKDVLYVLETNTNTALLAVLVHCFSYSISPVDVLKQHYAINSNGKCECIRKSEDDITCNYVMEFDLHNERLLQIGSFAVSCSSDEKRILALRSNLATLEALDPHLVPALLMAPESHHSLLLMNSWNKEVSEIRESVFLIVDPAAFAEKARQMMHQKLLDIIKENVYDNRKICSVINIGCVVYEFFDVYNKYEPNAINEREKLLSLWTDLNKVQLECKVVSDLLSSRDDFVYNIKKSKSAKNVTLDQMLKRLKLLYTIVNKISCLLHPKDSDDFFENEDDGATGNFDVTETIYGRNNETYLNSPKRTPKASRSIFARTTNIQSPFSKVPLFKLTKHLKQKKSQYLNSDQSDLQFANNRDSLTFFYSSIRKRPSLRKAIINRRKFTQEQQVFDEPNKSFEESNNVDDTLGLQITEVLNQITRNPWQLRTNVINFNEVKIVQEESTDNAHASKVNNVTITKHVWNNSSDMDSDASILTSNISQPSNVTTLERLNDLDIVETKLSDLRLMQLETSL